MTCSDPHPAKALVLALVSVLGYPSLSMAQVSCPANDFTLSVPTTEWEVECKARMQRCGSGLTPDECAIMNGEAIRLHLVDAGAIDWLYRNGQCAMVMFNKITQICPIGCFSAETQIDTMPSENLYISKHARDISKEDKLAALSSDSSLSSPAFARRSISDVTRGPETLQLFDFEMSNRRTLRVTQSHGMVLSSGQVVAAKDVKVGDSFVDTNGEPVVVERIGRSFTTDDVYNFRVRSDDPQEHVIVAEGVLVGDLSWQNELADEMESISLRR